MSETVHMPTTAGEIRKINGEVKSWKLGRPMDYETFKTMPKDLQAEYLQSLDKRLHPTNAWLAEMFGVSSMTVNNLRKRLNVYGVPLKTYRPNWEAWLRGEEAADEAATTEKNEPEPEPETEEAPDRVLYEIHPAERPPIVLEPALDMESYGKLQRALGHIEGIAIQLDGVAKDFLLDRVEEIDGIVAHLMEESHGEKT